MPTSHNVLPNYVYRNVCSCCGDSIDREQMKFLIDSGEADIEGNYCSQCYYDINRNNRDQIQEIIDKIYNGMSTPIKKFKWKYTPLDEQVDFIFRCVEKGYITWEIGR